MRRKPRGLMTTLTAPPPPPCRPKTPDASPRALYVLLLVVFINLVGFGLVIPLLPFYAKSLNAEAWQVTAAVLGLFAGPVLRRAVLGPAVGPHRPAAGADRHHPGQHARLRRPGLRPEHLAGPSRSAWSAAAAPATSRPSRATWPTSPRPRSAPDAWACWARRSASASWSVPPRALGVAFWPFRLGRLGFQLPIFAAAGLAAIAALGVPVRPREPRAQPQGRPGAAPRDHLAAAPWPIRCCRACCWSP
jgi:DHA1 family tetracycline resistance protein-like MFS transporter